MKTLTFQERSVYGHTNIYPIGPEAKAIETLTGKKTVDTSDLRALITLGFRCEMISDAVRQIVVL